MNDADSVIDELLRDWRLRERGGMSEYDAAYHPARKAGKSKTIADRLGAFALLCAFCDELKRRLMKQTQCIQCGRRIEAATDLALAEAIDAHLVEHGPEYAEFIRQNRATVDQHGIIMLHGRYYRPDGSRIHRDA
jgi:hypothetical protein